MTPGPLRERAAKAGAPEAETEPAQQGRRTSPPAPEVKPVARARGKQVAEAREKLGTHRVRQVPVVQTRALRAWEAPGVTPPNARTLATEPIATIGRAWRASSSRKFAYATLPISATATMSSLGSAFREAVQKRCLDLETA